MQLRSGITLLVVPEKKTGELTEADAKELSELLTDVLMPWKNCWKNGKNSDERGPGKPGRRAGKPTGSAKTPRF